MTRLEIQSMLENTLGSRNVYYQPPSSIQIKYPAIVYSLEGMTNNHASNGVYLTKKAYKVIYIDSNPDNEMVSVLNNIIRSTFNSYYVSDNLHHYAYTIYF